MALWVVVAKHSAYFGGVRLEKGMSVQVSSLVHNGINDNFLPIAGNNDINEAFRRVYGFDLMRAGMLTNYYLEAHLINNYDDSQSPMVGRAPSQMSDNKRDFLNFMLELLS